MSGHKNTSIAYNAQRETLSGGIWQIVFQTTFDKIKFGESLSGAHPKLYNYFTNNASKLV